MSAIDQLVPIAGKPTTASVRLNFAVARIEINQLEEAVAQLRAHVGELEARIAVLENRPRLVSNGR